MAQELLLQGRIVLVPLIPLAASPLLDNRARPPFGNAVTCLKMRHGGLPCFGLYQFFETTSCSISLSRLRSATSFFSLAFSASSAFSFLASDTSIPPNFAFHLYSVAVDIPCRRHRSPTLPPAMCSFNTRMICSSVNRFFMNLLLCERL